ncbi:hypothetical protein SELMODRAFT_444228 [Selaginella moellendorffii]|uniref:LysM domain-containing protein n=1 Tax=Selaginella moellendorffii TaxID=88036 RepID=D8S822_SELML|nr:hypothetical protein SELMODRAFT_444228 [Selaginella moellendorffii]
MRCLGHLHISVVEGRNLSVKIDARPSVLLQIGKEQARTAPLKNLSSKWLAEFRLDVASEDSCLTVTLLDDHSSHPVGKSLVPIRDLISIGTAVQWVTLKDPSGRDVGQICLVLRFLKEISNVKRENGASIPSAHHHLLNGDANSELSSSTSSLSREDDDQDGIVPQDDDHRSKKKDQAKNTGRSKYFVVAATAAATILLSVFAWTSHQKQKSKYHEVKEGDTMSSIANKYGLSPDDVFEANMSVTSDPDRIYPGDKIYIP